MGGDEAEEFMRQRYEVPGGDFGRMYNQQLVVKAVIDKLSKNDLLTDPLKFDNLVVTAAGALVVDKSLDLPRLAEAVRDIRPRNIKYATVPFTRADLRTPAGGRGAARRGQVGRDVRRDQGRPDRPLADRQPAGHAGELIGPPVGPTG